MNKENQQPTFERFIVSVGELAEDGLSVVPDVMGTFKDSVPNRLETLEPIWTLSVNMSDYVAPWLSKAGVIELTPQHLVDVQAMQTSLSPLSIPMARARLNWLANWIQHALMSYKKPTLVVETK